MLVHSPRLPLVIDYHEEDGNHDFTKKDKKGIVLALQCRDRVRRVRLCMPVPYLRKLIAAMDEEYPILEHLIIESTTESIKFHDTTTSMFESLQAPHLRHLLLADFSLSIRSRFLTTARDLVTLCLFLDKSSKPNTLLQLVSFIPQLETLVITFSSSSPNHIVELQLYSIPSTTHTVLPSLRWFSYQGVSAYLEALVGRLITPSLQQIQVDFFDQHTFPIPRLLQFINTIENLRFGVARLKFTDNGLVVTLYPHGAMTYAFGINVHSPFFYEQVSYIAQIFNELIQVTSAVEYLILEYEISPSHGGHFGADRTDWRQLLRTFSSVKTLRIDDWFATEFSCYFPLYDGERPLELLPELRELEYTWSSNLDHGLTSFIDARQRIARPVILIDSGSRPLKHSMPSPYRSATRYICYPTHRGW